MLHLLLRYPFLILLILSSYGSQAAVIREDFSNAVDYIGWQVMDAYMQDYLALRPKMVAEKKGYTLFQEQYSQDKYNIENPPSSKELQAFLMKNAWRNASTNLYANIINLKSAYKNTWTEKQAVDFLRTQIGNISVEPMGAQNDNDYKQLQAIKDRLTTEVTRYLSSESEAATPDTLIPVSEEVTTGETTAFSQSSGNEFQEFDIPVASEAEGEGLDAVGDFRYDINVISLAAILLLLGLLLYLFGLYKRLDHRLDKHSKRIEDLTTRLLLKKEGLSLEEGKHLKDKIVQLEAKLESAPPAPKAKPDAAPTPASYGRPATPPPPPPPVERAEYFLSTPNSDGTFNVSSMSDQFRPSASIYKFLVKQENGNSQADFMIADDYDAMRDALSSPGSYLDPVCESVNAYFPTAKRITNVRPGQAVRQGDKWVVKREHKALIRYE